MRAMTWAIRVTDAEGRTSFVRSGGIGRGPIVSFRTKEQADAEAERLSARLPGKVLTVIERSHGRAFTQ